MISRSSSALLSMICLLLGMILGILVGRGGSTMSAQVADSALQGGNRQPGQGVNPIADPLASGTGRDAQLTREDQLYALLAKQYEQFQPVNRTFELVAKAVSPSVVHIVAQKINRRDSLRQSHEEETGSGVIVRSDRSDGLYVLTNYHVVAGAAPARIQIRLHDGRTVVPEKVWSDWEADIAVLKLSQGDLPAARLGNSDEMTVGSWVLALGSPFGLMQSVSQGIISARGRHVDELEDIRNQDFLQTDAAINPGNSGGPLVNMKGELVGINNSIASNGGGNEGVGFTIPINLARWIMNELIARGKVSRGQLGVELHTPYRQKDATTLGLDRPRGAWVEKVHPNTPAALGGLQDGDVILRFGNVEITDLNHLINTVSMSPIGEAADVTIWRGAREMQLKITVGERESIPPQQMSRNSGQEDPQELLRRPERPASPANFALGLELVDISPRLIRQFSLVEQLKGALVMSVDPESPLAKICKPGDVIFSVAGHEIESAEQAVKQINARSDAGPFIVDFDRMGPKREIQRHSVQIP